MQCREFEDRLNELLDERSTPEGDPRLAAHAQACEPCGQLLAGTVVLVTGLAQLPSPALPADFSERIVAEVVDPVVPAEAVGDGRRAWWKIALLAATAACVMLAVSVVVVRRNRQHLPEIVQQNPDRPAKQPTEKPKSRGLAVVTPGPVAPKRAIPRQPGAKTPGFVSPFVTYGMTIESMAATLPDAVQRLDEMERITPGIRPIRMSFAMLLDALRRAFPGYSQENRSPRPASTVLPDPWRVA